MHRLGQWDELADALRDELAEYGGLLALLEEQKLVISKGDVDEILQMNLRVQEQTAIAARYKAIRDEVCARLSRAVGCGDSEHLSAFLPYMPEEARAMFEELISRGRDVAGKAKARGIRNAALLAKATELNDKLIAAINPQARSKTYNSHGTISVRTERSSSIDYSA